MNNFKLVLNKGGSIYHLNLFPKDIIKKIPLLYNSTD